MDIWLFAATAAAGCIAKQLQNVTKGKGNILESTSQENVKQEPPRRSLLSRLARVKKPNENKFEDEKPSTSGESSGNCEDVHSDSLFLLPEFPEIGCGYWKTCGVLGGETELSSFRQRRFVKPLSCMESCLMSRFHGEQMTMEEYMTSSFPSPRALDSRPLLVTDGSRVISKCTADSMWLNQQQMSLNEDKAACRNEKSKSRKHGLSDATVLLQIGISIGIMSSFMANQTKQELKQTENMVHDVGDELEMKDSLIGKEVAVEKAAESSESTSNIEAELKQTENVVHDVGDELEMKDSLIVKEVNTEKAGESLESISNIEAELKQTENVVHDVRDEVEMKDSLVVKEVDTEKAGESSESVSNIEAELKQTENMVHDVGDELEMKDSLKEVEDVEKAGESLESISNIEAELEAELERLEINMKTESNQDPSGNSTPESGNFAVSPRELSLRLHKVINSRLEKRITELETALQESQRKVEQLVTESESRKSSWSRVWEAREVMTYKSDSKTTEHTKTKVTNDAEMQPLVMNLKGEALDAFNESYDELMNLNDDSEDDDDESPVEMQESEVHHEDLSSASPLSHHQDDSKVQEQEQELVDFIGLEEQDEEENSDFESEMEKQLIKQIVEKTKQGSSVVLNAQKMLFLMEESEQNLKN